MVSTLRSAREGPAKSHSFPAVAMPKKSRKRKVREVEEEQGAAEVFSVEKIVSKKVVAGKTQYLLKWKGYDSGENTWEPEENLDCHDLLVDFNKRTAATKASATSKEEGSSSRGGTTAAPAAGGNTSSSSSGASAPVSLAGHGGATLKITQEDKVRIRRRAVLIDAHLLID